MKMTVTRPESGPSIEPELLVKFLAERCQKVSECPDVLASLALAALSQDLDFHERLKELISSSDSAKEILAMHTDLFVPALLGSPAALPETIDETEGYRALDKALHQTVLSYALEEGKRMISSGNYEFVEVFEVLTRSGLQPYAFRLYQFEDACQRFNDDPEGLVREGLKIIDLVTTSSTNQN